MTTAMEEVSLWLSLAADGADIGPADLARWGAALRRAGDEFTGALHASGNQLGAIESSVRLFQESSAAYSSRTGRLAKAITRRLDDIRTLDPKVLDDASLQSTLDEIRQMRQQAIAALGRPA